MSNTVIKVENLSKVYKLGQIGTGALYKDLNRWWARWRKKEDPYTSVNVKTPEAVEGYSWALKDINFEVGQGDVLGVIGKNGAGKSTLLKLLSRVTSPTTGSIKAKGRIASLLEVGTGFHPELTGRENIFLNGAILGMSRHEIRRKFDEIVDFSGVGKYIDTPVKRYSSGMYVRLAFGVAAHLESEILIIDEVLAVGDAEFQKKCLGKMGDVANKEGRTVLFVSHNLPALQEICKNGILLENGRLILSDKIDPCLKKYKLNSGNGSFNFITHKSDSELNWKISLLNESNSMAGNENIKVLINLSTKNKKFTNIKIDVAISNEDNLMLIHSRSNWKDYSYDLNANTSYNFLYSLGPQYLAPGNYFFTIYIYDGYDTFLYIEYIYLFEIKATNYLGNTEYLDQVMSVNVPPFTLEKI